MTNIDSSQLNFCVASPQDEQTIVAMAILFRNHLERDAPSDVQFGNSIRKLLTSQDAEFCIATYDEKPVGYVLQRFRYSMWASGLEATIEDLFVDPKSRKLGIGKSLIGFALSRAQKAGCVGVCLDTNEFNIASTKIYTGFGFDPFPSAGRVARFSFEKPCKRRSCKSL
ncbi:GNAT family N-acetyltransferase [Phyllobacterium sp. 628]|uniref:GNAT family N-acetyltransferase n=1 Tax=Phyllobacterium sp. 628 TaxID=2718938 RepID=UPI0016625D53|nr:GNAT family N-acetyltransferase [Phyllobacterium sp. 628]QND51014.1 GNAT family N-acetyltransferase [Phyllobacterium sp. 628]